AMARISHPNVVGVLDAGILDNEFFVVMEHIEGQTLDLWLQSRPAGKTVLDILRQIAAGIQSVHAAGLVHRDIKPTNVIITPESTAKLLDFGLARPATVADHADHARDQAGTPAYMAPELLRGEPASPQSDIYAFCLLADDALRSHPHDRARGFLQAGRAADPGARPASIAPFL
ncbi:MAG: serine/threonine-protein kinase, partial [Anaerolineae bacterium]